jgi:hypothetical protein
MKNEIENRINLRHPCIAAPIGLIFPIESSCPREFKFVRLYLEGCSLEEVLLEPPGWWTSTVKAKTIAGIVLGLRFAHSLGLIHGKLTTNNILFDLDHCIQIVDFRPILFEVCETADEYEDEDDEKGELGGFATQRWMPKRDLQAFASILSRIMIPRSATDKDSVPIKIPAFVSKILESGCSSSSETLHSFDAIFETLKQNNFRIESGVDSAEVFGFVNWVESLEYPVK